ncbi:uncharacterized protein LOC141892102 [Acropora palmata]|uniref:uncharacterized protein LOC141892102 n=1 Tax=Acropora palmata TaxID=6131 RepID=UPI003DA0AAD7
MTMSIQRRDTERVHNMAPQDVQHQKRWKTRLHRFQSNLRQSVRLKKGKSRELNNEERRINVDQDNDKQGVRRSTAHVRRESLPMEHHEETAPLEMTKETSRPHYQNGKTLLDIHSLDKRKCEKIKTKEKNASKEKKITAGSSSRNYVSELADGSQNKAKWKKRSQGSKQQKGNTNTQRTSLSKSKSLSILTNLFKRSRHAEDKNDRGKSSVSQPCVSEHLQSTDNSTNLDKFVTDINASSSSIDSYEDGDSHFNRTRKYYSLKRSKGSLIFPKKNLPRSFSLDDSMDPSNPTMEKSSTVASIPPCIRVEEYRENCGVFEKAHTVEFMPCSLYGSLDSSRATDVKGCSHDVTVEIPPARKVKQPLVSAPCKNGQIQATNIGHRAAKNSDANLRHSAPPSLQYSIPKLSSNIGSAISSEKNTDIATNYGNNHQIEQNSSEGGSKSFEEDNFCVENPDCGLDLEELNADMGNNSSFGQKPRKFNPKDAKLKLEFLRSFKKNGKSFYLQNACDGEADPIIEESDCMESCDRDFENGGLSYPTKRINAVNGLTKGKSSSLYEGAEALENCKTMIDIFQKNNNEQDFFYVKSTKGDSTQEGDKETSKVEEKIAADSSESLHNETVNNREKVSEDPFCCSICGQTDEKQLTQLQECLSCVKTRREVTHCHSAPCSPKFSESRGKINFSELDKQHLREPTSAELIANRLGKICNGQHGLVEKELKDLKVSSLPSSLKQSPLPGESKANMYHSFPDIRKLHAKHLFPIDLSSSNESINSTYSLNGDSDFETDIIVSPVENKEHKIARSPLSVEHSEPSGILKSRLIANHLSDGERLRSVSATNSPRSPVQQVFFNENRSVSCTQLNKNNDNPTCCSPPPYVRPRIQSLEQLPPCTAQVILRKKKSIIRKNRMRHTTSLSSVDNVFSEMIDGGKRHSYGGYGDTLFPQLPAYLLQRSNSAESFNSCGSSQQSINSNTSFADNGLGSTFSINSELAIPRNLDVNLNRSRSVPGFLGISDMRQNSPIPEERTSMSDWQSDSAEHSGHQYDDNEEDVDDDDYDEDYDDAMEVPEAFAEALWDHVTMDPEELSFQAGDIITVLTMTSCDWWFGQVGDQVGWFPAPFVRVRISQTLGADETKLAQSVRTRKGTNEGFLSDADVRSRVVLEILNTEKDYVKNLEDVVEGYLNQARKRTDMFTEESIAKIFSNIEQIYEFHLEILMQFEDCFVEDDPCASEIGSVFLNNKRGFEIYSEYCNNHPHAMEELKTLCESNKYKQFFEACRLLQDMINISLDGFLLTPVQKICKYPLQLAELKKHTKPSHKDYEKVSQALETMKDVASLINERKRKVESINKIARWQSTIESWEGEDVLERSSELIHSGDVIKTSNGSSQSCSMFLFDHQLVYCKKDILKKNGLTYKGRIDMDDCTFVWVGDGEESFDRSPLNNAWKIYNFKKEKWYIFYTKNAAQKEKWMKAFTEERRRVSEDAKTGLIISLNTRKAAMRAAKASVKQKKHNGGKKERPLLKSQSTTEIKPPPSPRLLLPAPVSSADLREVDESEELADSLGARSAVIRRSFGLRGSKKSKEKRKSSVF